MGAPYHDSSPYLTPQRNFLEIIGSRFGEMDSALGAVCRHSQDGVEGLRELAACVQRLETKLDRMAATLRDGDREGHTPGRESRSMAQRRSTVSGEAVGSKEGAGSLSDRGRDDRGHISSKEDPGEQRGSAPRTVRHEKDDSRRVEEKESALDRNGTDEVAALHMPKFETIDDLCEDEVPADGLDDVLPAEKTDSLDMKLDGLDKKLEKIASAVGARLGTGINEEEDRRRLKEKLKEALDSAARNRMQKIDSEHEVWMEYLFGICKPDGRIGKSGSKCEFQ